MAEPGRHPCRQRISPLLWPRTARRRLDCTRTSLPATATWIRKVGPDGPSRSVTSQVERRSLTVIEFVEAKPPRSPSSWRVPASSSGHRGSRGDHRLGEIALLAGHGGDLSADECASISPRTSVRGHSSRLASACRRHDRGHRGQDQQGCEQGEIRRDHERRVRWTARLRELPMRPASTPNSRTSAPCRKRKSFWIARLIQSG